MASASLTPRIRLKKRLGTGGKLPGPKPIPAWMHLVCVVICLGIACLELFKLHSPSGAGFCLGVAVGNLICWKIAK